MVTYIIICFMVSSLTVIGIILAKRIFHKQLTAKGQYHLWFLLLIALILPFIPVQFFSFEDSYIAWDFNQGNESGSSFRITEEVQNSNWMQDYSISVDRSNLEYVNIVTACIWIAGMFGWTVLAIKAGLEVKKIKRTTKPVENTEIQVMFEQCKEQLNLSKPIVLGESRLVNSPMTFGLFKSYVVLPVHFDEWLSMDEIHYIFLHELHHYKSKDIAVNYLMVIFQIIYWFNPLVWIAFRKMRLDREIACDHAVLSSLDENCHKEYGMTMIHFIDQMSRQKNVPLANQFNGSKKQLKSRIKRIASYTKETKRLKLKSTVIFTLLGVLVASQVPLISAMANDQHHYDFKGENALYLDLNEHFTGYDGSFVLYDLQADQYQIYNKNKSTLRVSPNSTYKIYSALFGLESNLISRENSTIKWDGTLYPFDSWNSEQNVRTAMKNSVTWYFQELDKRNQAGDIHSFLREINYGNSDLSGGISQFWLESSLKISPIEQVQLLTDLYTNELGFKEKNIQTVKEAILLEEKSDGILSGKTGTGTVNGNEINGWFIGYVEMDENTFFFATNIQNKENASGRMAAEITLSILEEKGIY
ncbi:BlaR1 family beta-lactam sensor/signal transducer [Mesobacillus maritimus]|uniref:BlaR1 family beta-lactam sensor/signal transducer n=1 Tax=Mesobacillus maritimus TaxID=1643336 RepID=A0ABS7K941_9BACI|nr:BlaR1 family beta-lactam sensor/signal transducer [Mesobacillus maritimus]MBY0098740.1 BlaR1 family beta-lactam sensor/signal transducer [Mesobacillus maritimus]